MASTWFVLLAFMLTVYALLDGFDLGAGVLHLFVARDDAERRTVFAAIGPVWDGNEVWLIASGGVLVFAFPKLYAVAFSGFYLALMVMLWLLVLRGISIELRSHQANILWRQFFDTLFAGASALLAFVLGVALGNVLRGVPIGADGYFSSPLFTDFARNGALGTLDWYTISVGLFTVSILAAHGAMFLRWKTEGELNVRTTRIARWLWGAVTVLATSVAIETAIVRPQLFHHFAERPALWPVPIVVIASFVIAFLSLARGWELRGFAASALGIAALFVVIAGSLYPLMLPSTIDPAFSLSVDSAANERDSLAIGLAWWIPAVVLALVYFAYLFWSFRGKTSASGREN